MQFTPNSRIADPDIWAEIESCLALARETGAALAAGERLTSARLAVELVRAYDRVLENARLIPLSAQELQRMRDQLSPVREQLRKYRLR